MNTYFYEYIILMFFFIIYLNVFIEYIVKHPGQDLRQIPGTLGIRQVYTPRWGTYTFTTY